MQLHLQRLLLHTPLQPVAKRCMHERMRMMHTYAAKLLPMQCMRWLLACEWSANGESVVKLTPSRQGSS